jgi:molybdopterin-binding protein
MVPQMSTYKVGQVAELLGVSTDTVRRWADSGRLTMEREASGQRVIDGADLARFLTETAPEPSEPPLVSESARNRFPGIVTKVEKDGLVAVVHLQAGPHRVVSMMTREAADELQLSPGDLAVGVVKSTNVVVEVIRPEQPRP